MSNASEFVAVVSDDPGTSGSSMKRLVIGGLLIALSLMLIYTSGFGQFSVMVQRGVPLMLSMVVIFLLFPFGGKKGESHRPGAAVIDGLLIAGTMLSVGYVIFYHDTIAARMGITTPADVLAAVVGLICLLEATRRAAGTALVVLSCVFLAYAFAGPYLPGLLYHDGFELSRVARMQWTGVTGVFGSILDVMVKIIFVFILLAEFLRLTRAGDYIIDFALSLTGRFQGGPALTAILSSMLFGSVSGSPVANVVGTGAFTIPLMRRYGFDPRIAGAVEAAASSGGYLMPPIMGAAAFVMAEFTGISYIQIAMVAAVPALVYFLSLFCGAYVYSQRIGVRPIPPQDLPRTSVVLKNGMHVFLVLPVLMGMLMAGYTASRACFATLVALFVLSSLRSDTRLRLVGVIQGLRGGAEKSIGLMAATASMGIIIGAMDLTGLGTSIGFAVELAAGASLPLALVLVMGASMLIGMGVAPVATYVLLVVTLVPVLGTLGLSVLNAHFFILYFSTYAVITPPVGLAAYAAAGIAGGDPLRTSVEAFKLGLPGFVLPFLFVYYPEILHDGSVLKTALLALFALAVLLPLNFANFGYLFGPLGRGGRLLIALGSATMCLLAISPLFFGAGVATILGVAWYQYVSAQRVPLATAARPALEDRR